MHAESIVFSHPFCDLEEKALDVAYEQGEETLGSADPAGILKCLSARFILQCAKYHVQFPLSLLPLKRKQCAWGESDEKGCNGKLNTAIKILGCDFREEYFVNERESLFSLNNKWTAMLLPSIDFVDTTDVVIEC